MISMEFVLLVKLSWRKTAIIQSFFIRNGVKWEMIRKRLLGWLGKILSHSLLLYSNKKIISWYITTNWDIIQTRCDNGKIMCPFLGDIQYFHRKWLVSYRYSVKYIYIITTVYCGKINSLYNVRLTLQLSSRNAWNRYKWDST